jgi:hypothetical protein
MKGRPPPEKLLPSLHSKLRKLILRSASADITLQDPVVKAIYLGNLVTTWAKGDGCLDRPASALWKNHVQGRGSIRMTVVVTPGGLKAETREHGLTEYWNNRLTWCGVPVDFPKLFCWIYRHETRKLKQELRCHAVICSSKEDAMVLSETLRYRLAESLFDFRKEKLQRQNARLSSLNSYHNNNGNGGNNGGYYVQDNQSLNNYRRERPSPSKLSIIEESAEEDNYPTATAATLRAAYDQVMEYLEMRSQGLAALYNYKSNPNPRPATHSLSSTAASSEAEEVSDSSAENSEDEVTHHNNSHSHSHSHSQSMSMSISTNKNHLYLNDHHQRIIFEDISYDI